jgi:hypothetical protein
MTGSIDIQGRVQVFTQPGPAISGRRVRTKNSVCTTAKIKRQHHSRDGITCNPSIEVYVNVIPQSLCRQKAGK